jgi:hypothetical protein
MGWFIDRLRPTHPDYDTLSKVQFWEQVRPEGA